MRGRPTEIQYTVPAGVGLGSGWPPAAARRRGGRRAGGSTVLPRENPNYQVLAPACPRWPCSGSARGSVDASDNPRDGPAVGLLAVSVDAAITSSGFEGFRKSGRPLCTSSATPTSPRLGLFLLSYGRDTESWQCLAGRWLSTAKGWCSLIRPTRSTHKRATRYQRHGWTQKSLSDANVPRECAQRRLRVPSRPLPRVREHAQQLLWRGSFTVYKLLMERCELRCILLGTRGLSLLPNSWQGHIVLHSTMHKSNLAPATLNVFSGVYP